MEKYLSGLMDAHSLYKVICVTKRLVKASNFITFLDNHLVTGIDPKTDQNFDRYTVNLLILFLKELNSNLLLIQML